MYYRRESIILIIIAIDIIFNVFELNDKNIIIKKTVATCTSPLGKPNDPSLIGNICNVLGGRVIEKPF